MDSVRRRTYTPFGSAPKARVQIGLGWGCWCGSKYGRQSRPVGRCQFGLMNEEYAGLRLAAGGLMNDFPSVFFSL